VHFGVTNMPGAVPRTASQALSTVLTPYVLKLATDGGLNDPAIAKLNPSAKLPSQAIAVVHRSDGSGTTYNFAYYLAEVSPAWKSKVGQRRSMAGRHRRQGNKASPTTSPRPRARSLCRIRHARRTN
jgi:hypothetical protein